MTRRRWAVLADGFLTDRHAKTAHGLIHYGRDPIGAVIDRDNAGRSLSEVLPALKNDAPIVASLRDAMKFDVTSLLLGVATPGGWMPAHWRGWLVEAVSEGLEIANGLHRFLRDDPELVELANSSGARLWDVRDPPRDIPLFSGKTLEVPQKIVLTVGSDCAVGKMTVALEMVAAAAAAGVSTEFVATGQTGILIAGWGIAVDRVISDFVAGAAEKLVCDAPACDVVVVEGQGSLWHPAYSGVTLGLLHGTTPHAMVMCHEAGRTAIGDPPYPKLPPLTEMIAIYERSASVVRPSRVSCIAVNCAGLSDHDRRRTLESTEDETGLPAGDVLAGDAPRLWEAVGAAL